MDKFGYAGNFVQNQRNALGVWISPLNAFPSDIQNGRILINSINGAVYLDVDGVRQLIQGGGSGGVSYVNGLSAISTGDPYSSSAGLGGEMLTNTVINLETNNVFLRFVGTETNFNINANGQISDQNTLGLYLPCTVNNNPVVVPDCKLIFTDVATGVEYKVAAQQY